MLEVIRLARTHENRPAILSEGIITTYRTLLERSEEIASALLQGAEDLNERRVAFMVEPGIDYVATLWGVWQAGGIAVPLCLTHPRPALEHALKDSGCMTALVSKKYEQVVRPVCSDANISIFVLESIGKEKKQQFPIIEPNRRAMILFTSGTTNLPKGVVTTHRNINAQISTLVKAWQWTMVDRTLCVLPLHHVHGIINVVSCSMWSGARCEFVPEFEPSKVLNKLRHGEVNVFMAVPTIYYKLIAAWDQQAVAHQKEISSALKAMRLMVSGSAALPVSVMNKWEQISGHKLLERYGMTELGMAISNPYSGPRLAGKVGLPLEGVSVRLCDDRNEPVVDEPGEIQVKGENVFLEYWNQAQATRDAFTPDGWFKTGDVAVVEDGYYRILGRSSVDIIKSGGYKISALEIEEVLRTHPQVKDCAVVGLDDEEWGEIVAAALVAVDKAPGLEALSLWLKERIPAYRVPRQFVTVHDLPRNAMGKVIKNEVKKLFSNQ